jgi:MFS family permease
MRSFGAAYALYVLVQGVAMGVAPPLFGALQERFDSYQPMYWTLCVAALVGATLYLVLGPYRYGVGNEANVPKRREK